MYLAIALVMMACEKKEAELELPGMDDDVQTESFQVRYFFSDSAISSVVLEGTRVIEKRDPGTNQSTLYFYDGVDIDFLGNGGVKTSHARANEAIYFREKNYAELKGDVKLTSITGERLETSILYWDEVKDSVYTYEPVRVYTAKQIIFGKNGLKANTAFTSYQFFKVTGGFEAETEAPTQP